MAILPESREQGEQTIEDSRKLGSPYGFLVEYRPESVKTPAVFRAREAGGKNYRTQTRYGVLRRFIGKWLKAGVMEDGALSFSESGTPQGGVISPLLANIYLHYVLDEWLSLEK